MVSAPVTLLAGGDTMDHRIKSYVRPLLRRWGLTQKELAFLIGSGSAGVISRIEGFKRAPSLAATFAFVVFFDMPPKELFPELHARVRDAVLGRAYELYESLQGNPSRTTRMKLDFLEEAVARIEAYRLSEANEAV
jgi:transcriptional regulator with XRE-family HTH domain